MVGRLSQPEREVDDLENLLPAGTKDLADWHFLSDVSKWRADPGIMQTIQAAANEVESVEDEHLA